VLGKIDERFWPRWRMVAEHVEPIWRQPDDGIWGDAGGRDATSPSKVMAWVVFDRAVRVAEQVELEAPLDRWKQTRDEIHEEVCEQGYDRERRTFSQ
jgi:GH15 family glucan-1,4-alpha-glucosidase